MKRFLILAGSMAVVGLFLCAPAQAAKMHFVHVKVGENPVRWQSKQTFRRQGVVRLRFWSNGRELLYADGVTRCRARSYGWGLVVRASTCGKRAPLTIRAVSLNGTRDLRIGWRIERK